MFFFQVNQEFSESGKVAMGKVDCDAETGISKRFKISKYPTLKLSINGDVRHEYRGTRTTEALVQFIRDQMKDPVKEFKSLDEIKGLSAKKRVIIAYFDKPGTPEYNIYRKVASNLKDDCDFYAGFGETVSNVLPGG